MRFFSHALWQCVAWLFLISCHVSLCAACCEVSCPRTRVDNMMKRADMLIAPISYRRRTGIRTGGFRSHRHRATTRTHHGRNYNCRALPKRLLTYLLYVFINPDARLRCGPCATARPDDDGDASIINTCSALLRGYCNKINGAMSIRYQTITIIIRKETIDGISAIIRHNGIGRQQYHTRKMTSQYS